MPFDRKFSNCQLDFPLLSKNVIRYLRFSLLADIFAYNVVMKGNSTHIPLLTPGVSPVSFNFAKLLFHSFEV